MRFKNQLPLTLFILFFSISLFAKKGDKVPGYVIDNDGKRTEGKVIIGSITENEVKVFREVSESPSGLIFILIGVFLFGIVALILSQLSDVKSKELANELHPILQDLK